MMQKELLDNLYIINSENECFDDEIEDDECTENE